MAVFVMVPRARTHAHLLFHPHVLSIHSAWSSVVDQMMCSRLEESRILKLNFSEQASVQVA